MKKLDSTTLTLSCSACNATLTFQVDHYEAEKYGSISLLVEPCQDCLRDAREEARLAAKESDVVCDENIGPSVFIPTGFEHRVAGAKKQRP